MKNLSAGIDFGTTNSSAALANGATPCMVSVENDSITIPTAMYIIQNSPDVYFGRDAIARYTDGADDGRLMRSLKRTLGTSLMSGRGTQIGARMLKFDTVIETFVRHLKSKIDAAAGTDVRNVVMGRPVHFCDNDPVGDARAESELRQIAQNAGFKNIEFQFEPIAAAFAQERHLTNERLAMVIDIGGGTSDFAVIRLGGMHAKKTDRTNDILANAGVRVGGNDLDKDLSLRSFMPTFGMGTEIGGKLGVHDKILPFPNAPFFSLSTWNEINNLYNFKSINQIQKYLFGSRSPEKAKRLVQIVTNNLGHKNLDYVEQGKIKLSDKNKIKIVLDFLSDTPTVFATRAEFENAIQKNIGRVSDSMDECVKLAGVKNADISLVILTGGSTEIPYVRDTLCSVFPNAKVFGGDKLSSVALGLSFDAVRRFNV